MKGTLEHMVLDAYERGRLDEEIGVSTDLSLFTKCAAAGILGGETVELAAKYIPDASIVELPDGRLCVSCQKWEHKGYRLVKVSADLGVEVRAGTILKVRKYPVDLATALLEAIAMEGE